MEFVNCIEHIDLWNAGYVELWDFSKANSCQKAREEAVALVSSVCYGKKIVNPAKHYQRMLTEHGGKASGILGFIPIKGAIYNDLNISSGNQDHNIFNKFYRFCYIAEDHVYTNMRNAVNNDMKSCYFDSDAENFVVFKIKIPYMIVDNLRRHKLLESAFAENWQSFRITHENAYFENEEIQVREHIWEQEFTRCKEKLNTIQKTKNCRPELYAKGADFLRYTTGFIGGWLQDPATWENFFSVRLHKPAQKETIELATAMKTLIDKYY